MAIDVHNLPPLDLTKIRQQKMQNTASNIQKDATNGGKIILAWIVTITILVALSRTRFGYVVFYYVLWLGIVMVILASAPQLGELLMLVKAPDGPSGE